MGEAPRWERVSAVSEVEFGVNVAYKDGPANKKGVEPPDTTVRPYARTQTQTRSAVPCRAAQRSAVQLRLRPTTLSAPNLRTLLADCRATADKCLRPLRTCTLTRTLTCSLARTLARALMALRRRAQPRSRRRHGALAEAAAASLRLASVRPTCLGAADSPPARRRAASTCAHQVGVCPQAASATGPPSRRGQLQDPSQRPPHDRTSGLP